MAARPTCRDCEFLVLGECKHASVTSFKPCGDLLNAPICVGCKPRGNATHLKTADQLISYTTGKVVPVGYVAITPTPAAKPSTTLPTDSAKRKEIPLVRGLLDYFPAALAAVAAVSKAGNDQHNPGQEMHHARGKSMDHADCIVRHLIERGTVDTDGQRHMAKVAWRALALLQEELEREEGAPLPRGARVE